MIGVLGGHQPALRGTKEPMTGPSRLLRAVPSGQKETQSSVCPGLFHPDTPCLPGSMTSGTLRATRGFPSVSACFRADNLNTIPEAKVKQTFEYNPELQCSLNYTGWQGSPQGSAPPDPPAPPHPRHRGRSLRGRYKHVMTY